MELLAILAGVGIVTIVVGGSLAGLIALALVLRTRRALGRGQPSPVELAAVLDRLAVLERMTAGRPTVDAPPAEPAADASPAPAPTPVDTPAPTDLDHPGPSWARSVDDRPAQPLASPPPSPPTPEQPTAAPRSSGIEWERWIGVRGAAAAGAAVLALAALLLFQYTIEHDLITAPMRIVIGLATGVGCIVLSQWLIRREQPFAANGLTGAGITALYASFWAAHALYGLIGWLPAFVLMALTTVLCGGLSRHRGSLLVAVLGLLGGFATPLLVSSGANHPVTLFGYVLLLDAGLLWLARERGWPLLAFLSVAGTALHQLLWMMSRLNADTLPLGLAVLAVFAVAFVASAAGSAGPLWRWTTVGAITIPFGFAVMIAGRADLGNRVGSVGGLLVLLAALACWLARDRHAVVLATAAAAATLAVVTVWFVGHDPTGGQLWVAVAVAITTAAVFHVAWELDRGSQPGRFTAAAVVAAGGTLLLLVVLSLQGASQLWPWLFGWTATAAMVVRQAADPGRNRLQLLGWLGLAAGLTLFTLSHTGSPDAPRLNLVMLVAVLIALAAQAARGLWRNPAQLVQADQAAAAASCALLIVSMVPSGAAPGAPLSALAFALLMGLLTAAAAARLHSPAWLAAAVAMSALSHGAWTDRWSLVDAIPPTAALALQAAAVLVMTLWPLRARPAFDEQPHAWRVAALAGPAWFPSLTWLYQQRFSDAAIGIVPLALGGIAIAAAALVRMWWPAATPARVVATTWYAAVAVSFVSIAIPLQLDREWITIGWALNGLALIALWRRIDHPGLKHFGFALLTAATIRLVANPAVLSYAERGPWPVLNWMLYTYLVPAAALLTTSALLAPLEVPRLREWERRIQGLHPMLTVATGVAAVAVVFVWINLAIADLFSTSPTLEISLERMPARDLATSIAWAVYGLCLLIVGVRGRSLTLRWLSLLLFVATLAKVFLHDLGELRDLYRVASLAGLAVSLIIVSLIYQRFVLRPSPSQRQKER